MRVAFGKASTRALRCVANEEWLSQACSATNGLINGVGSLPDALRSGGACSARASSADAACACAPWHSAFGALRIRGISSATQSAEDAFHRNVDETLETLLEDLENIIDDRGIEGTDIEYGQGVLTMKLGDKGTYVINKQAPNQQIWMSSPVSGPVRYDFDGGHWVYARDGHHMHSRLESELATLLGGEISLTRRG